jgi:hypothetical protein
MSPYAWALALIVSLASLAVSIKISTLQQSGNRPEIIFARLQLRDPYDDGLFDIGMTNVGTRTAYYYRLDIKTVGLKWSNSEARNRHWDQPYKATRRC